MQRARGRATIHGLTGSEHARVKDSFMYSATSLESGQTKQQQLNTHTANTDAFVRTTYSIVLSLYLAPAIRTLHLNRFDQLHYLWQSLERIQMHKLCGVVKHAHAKVAR